MASRKEQREAAREERVQREQEARDALLQDPPVYAGFPVVSTDNLPDDGWVQVRKTTLGRARKMDAAFVCFTIDGNMAAGHAGDYLMVDDQGFPYPCNEEVFKNSYEVVDG